MISLVDKESNVDVSASTPSSSSADILRPLRAEQREQRRQAVLHGASTRTAAHQPHADHEATARPAPDPCEARQVCGIWELISNLHTPQTSSVLKTRYMTSTLVCLTQAVRSIVNSLSAPYQANSHLSGSLWRLETKSGSRKILVMGVG